MSRSRVRRPLAGGIAIAAASTTVGLLASPSATADPDAGAWSRLRACESSGNYQAVDSSGAHFGAYQFDQSTWNSVGGTGRPDHAAPAEQDYRALYLYRMRGWQPWECADGAHLNLRGDSGAASGRVPSYAEASRLNGGQYVAPATPAPRPVAAARSVPPPPAAPAPAAPGLPTPAELAAGLIPPAGSGALVEPSLPGVELTYGMCSPVLAQWQLQLNRYGYGFDGSGCYGAKTRTAVQQVQFANGIAANDAIGPYTLAAAYVGRAPR